MTAHFHPDQRVASENEPELGIGIVRAADARRVHVEYPRASELRAYASANAPLVRVRFGSGDRIKSADGLALEVVDVHEDEHLLVYECRDPARGRNHRLAESELSSSLEFGGAAARLIAGHFDKPASFRLRRDARDRVHRWIQSPARGLVGARVELLDHQLYIAQDVADREHPRVLLADEVGLGKTIEAGLIMHRRLLEGRSRRILIGVPESLQHQWLVELIRRFNIRPTLIDADHFVDAETNPFELAQVVLCDVALLAERLADALDAAFDLLVVDEAHRLSFGTSAPVADAVEQLAAVIPGVLLLTATPERAGIDSHFQRLRVLDPERYVNAERFHNEQQQFIALAELAQVVADSDGPGSLDPQQGQRLAELVGPEAVEQWDASGHGEDVLGRLLDRHGTGRALFRNTRAAVGGFPWREVTILPLEAEHDAGEETADAVIPAAIGDELIDDPRVDWLLDWLAEHRAEKALLICSGMDTAKALEEILRRGEAVRCVAFHEGLSLIERDRAAAWFADAENPAQLLITSEIGSEGRNFQFARYLILFDLPLDPDLLEQRIGRLDRIGRREKVQIIVPCLAGPHHRLARWYDEGLDAFENVSAVGDAVMTALGDRVLEAVAAPEDETVESLIADTKAIVEELEARHSAGRDRLLELNSNRSWVVAPLRREIEDLGRPDRVRAFVESLADVCGLEHEVHSEHAIILRPGDHMLAALPGLPEDGITLTFDRATALAREDLAFATWEHPLVRHGLDLMSTGSIGATTLCTMAGASPASPILLEAFYTADGLGQTLRLLVDQEGHDCAQRLASATIDARGKRVQPQVARAFAGRGGELVREMLGNGSRLAAQRQPEVIEQARAALHRQFDEEIARLSYLAEVNPSIDKDELAALKLRAKDALARIEGADLRLDAARLVIFAD